MADRSVLIGWGEVVRGRERRALEVFGEGMAFYEEAVQDGRLAGMEVVLLEPTGSDLDGFWLLRGGEEQLRALRDDERWLRMIAEAALVVDDLRVVDGYVDQGVTEPMARYADALSTVLATA